MSVIVSECSFSCTFAHVGREGSVCWSILQKSYFGAGFWLENQLEMENWGIWYVYVQIEVLHLGAYSYPKIKIGYETIN